MALLEVTAPAAQRIGELLDKEGKRATHGLRLKVVGGGCSGLRYELAFDDKVGERPAVGRRGRERGLQQPSPFVQPPGARRAHALGAQRGGILRGRRDGGEQGGDETQGEKPMAVSGACGRRQGEAS